jgi:hypothetical protein
VGQEEMYEALGQRRSHLRGFSHVENDDRPPNK